VAVTLLIFAIGVLLVLQGLNTAKISAAQTHNRKVARELALLTIGRVESGLFWEDLGGEADVQFGTYADEGYEDFRWEVVLGQDNFPSDYNEQGDRGYFDNYAHKRQVLEEEQRNSDSQDEEERTAEPFEKVRVKVTFPKFGDADPELLVERWIPWSLVYGDDEEEQQTEDGGTNP